MPRMLVVAEHRVQQTSREGYLEAVQVRRAKAAAAGANFWAFERVASDGVFLEFVEAGNVAALTAAVAVVNLADGNLGGNAPVWREVGGA